MWRLVQALAPEVQADVAISAGVRASGASQYGSWCR